MRQTALWIAIVLITSLVVACQPPEDPLAANKAILERFTEISNAGDWEALGEVVADDFVRHSQATAGPPVTSLEAFIELQKGFATSMPDQKVTPRIMVAEGDKMAALATYSGTHTGPMGDFPITNKKVELDFLGIFRFENGKIAELWVEWDNIAMLSQLGLFPPPAPAAEPEPVPEAE